MGTLWGTLEAELHAQPGGALFKPSRRRGALWVPEQQAPPKSSQLRDTHKERSTVGAHGIPRPGTWVVGPDSPQGPCLSGPLHPHQATLGAWVLQGEDPRGRSRLRGNG